MIIRSSGTGSVLSAHEAYVAYAAAAEARIAAIDGPADGDVVSTPSKREAPRIPFGWLVERGLIEPGEVLFDTRRRHTARVRADGRLIARDFTGSIHQVGARLQGAPSCNGWSFWFVERDGGPVPIDHYRQQIRAQLS